MDQNNLFVSAAESVAFGGSDQNSQSGDYSIKVHVQHPKVFSFKPSGSDKIAELKGANIKFNQYKCFNCYGQGEEVSHHCRVCEGSQSIGDQHPIISAMRDILKKKASHWSSGDAKTSLGNNFLGAELQVHDIINEESFSTPQDWTSVCLVCKRVFELAENQKKMRSKHTKCPQCLLKDSQKHESQGKWLTVDKNKKSDRATRLRKISEQIDSEDGFSFLLKGGIMKDDSFSNIELSSKEDFSGQNPRGSEIIKIHQQGNENNEENVLLDSLVILDKAQLQKPSLLNTGKESFNISESNCESPSHQRTEDAQFKLDYSNIKPKKEQMSSLTQIRAHQLSQVQRFKSQDSFGDLNNFSLQAGSSHSALNEKKHFQKNQQNKNHSAFWENLNFSMTSKAYQFTNYACDSCNIQPILNKRFHCKKCEDFDLCQRCFLYNKNDHLHSDWAQIDGLDIIAERQRFVEKQITKKESELRGSFNMLNSDIKHKF